MKFGKVVIAGCLKNSASFLPQVLHNIEAILQLFDDAAFVFVENDSSDETKSTIRRWGEGRERFKLLNLDGLDQYEKNRTVRLEIARNAYVEVIKKDPTLRHFDHLILMDMDDRGAYPLNLDAVKTALMFIHEKVEHAAIFANQLIRYYDLWALRHPQLCPFDFWHEVLEHVLQGQTDQVAFDTVYAQVLKRIPVDMGPIEVESAFGGLGIYKMSYVVNNKMRYIGRACRYTPRAPMGFLELQTCEHVTFHQGISAQGGKLFILPQLINSDQDTSFNPSAYRTLMLQR